MVKSEEIVERTFYVSLLKTLLQAELTINPDDYLPLSVENEKAFQEAKGALTKFVYLFGVGNNQVRGAKTNPRITIELNGYFPGDLGVPHTVINGNTEENPYQIVEYPWEVKDITLDIHLVANTQADMRLLHEVLFRALPPRGYITPYLDNDFEAWREKKVQPDGNLYIEVTNFYDHPDLEHGMLEKVYTYLVKDGILEETLHPDDPDYTLVPMKDISLLIGPEEADENNYVQVHAPN